MQEIHSFFEQLHLGTELLAAVVGAFYLSKLKNSYWRWFSVYLIVIFLQELFWSKISTLDREDHLLYYVVFGIPLEYIFFYWLFAYKSLQNRKLFLFISSFYLIIVLVLLYFKTLFETLKLMSNVGTTILIVLLILEFLKQIKSDEILKFKENKMFYINIGMILFYVGSLPFEVFAKELYENHKNIYDIYYLYFLVSNCIMYFMFTISFIWGKTRS